MTNEQGGGEEKQTKCCDLTKCGSKKCGSGCASGCFIYCLGFVGALVYFIQHSETFWMGVLGVLKAIAWPALVIHRVLEVLQF
ncbi:MAG: hypothetical protein AB1333_01415 [Patescibacteria group bacterium]